jgi:general secretion pathway protein A
MLCRVGQGCVQSQFRRDTPDAPGIRAPRGRAGTGPTGMYESFYGLKHKPFQTVPDPRFLYWAKGHELAITMLRYGLMTAAPVTVITGEVGAGKTTLLRHLMTEMPGDLVVGLVSNMQAGKGELLEWVMMALDQPFEGLSYVRLFEAFQSFVIGRYAEGKRVVLIFDEAQNLDVTTLEELRLLSNINADGEQLLQLILVGQPELRELLNDRRLKQFAQRIVADFHLSPLEADEVEPYIDRRLKLAGARWKIFPSATCRLLHEATGGVPRLINALCDLCLVSGFSAEEKVVRADLLREFLDSAGRHAIYRQFLPLGAAPDGAADRPLLLGAAESEAGGQAGGQAGGPAGGSVISWPWRGGAE